MVTGSQFSKNVDEAHQITASNMGEKYCSFAEVIENNEIQIWYKLMGNWDEKSTLRINEQFDKWATERGLKAFRVF